LDFTCPPSRAAQARRAGILDNVLWILNLPCGLLPGAVLPKVEFHMVKIKRYGFEEENMRRYVLLIMLAFLQTACTSGKTEYFPSQGYSADMAEVTVIRETRMFGFGFSMKVVLDGEVIARLKAGQYVTFYTDPGVRTIGIPDESISAALERGRKHYFAIKTDSSQFGFEIERISERKAESWMAKSKPIE